MKAKCDSWKTLPPPEQKEYFDLPLMFSDADGERLQQGHIPQGGEDEWFVFFEDGWLFFHDSGTGACIFGVRLDGSPAGVRVAEAWASRDSAHYRSPGLAQERQLVEQLIASLLRAE